METELPGGHTYRSVGIGGNGVGIGVGGTGSLKMTVWGLRPADTLQRAERDRRKIRIWRMAGNFRSKSTIEML
jgi:hypothetical protein